eukprot:TRINITY_DN9978_c0_g1_i1.p2 TRINITY_DN9978_c0_g1~~TRINITY_DN9978_c0_g1_i1.p2  ORF type:complete len:348 (+),score=139.76 TRINITY_DN9978_c0_g1_i1:73-1116(+)
MQLGRSVVNGLRSRALLTDTHGRFHDYLRISIAERCNLRCQYCMPKDGVDLTPDNELLSTEEIVRLASVFTRMGVKKIRLTGGEPLVRKDFKFLAKKLGDLRAEGLEKLCITSNGLLVSKHLDVLEASGMTNINISLDTLEAHKFEFITRRRGFDRVLKAVHDCVDRGFNTKLNVVVLRNINDEEVAKFAQMAADLPMEVRFIEYMPFDGNNWNESLLVPWMQTVDAIEAAMDIKLHMLPGGRGDVSKKYAAPGWQGRVGFITTMTSSFCGGCNRLRLLADGKLKTCLFDTKERSLLEVLRSDATDHAISQHISTILSEKPSALGGHTVETLADFSHENRPMIKIGG